MRLVPFDGLPASLERDAAAVQLAAFSGFLSPAVVAKYRRRPNAFADYVAVFAVDRGTVVGETFVLRLPYRSRSGVETIAAIASVTTVVSESRRGVARRVLDEVHRREVAAGTRFAFLWTSQSWRAHGLYEQLGYRDVFVSPLAVRLAPGHRRLCRGDSLRAATRAELPRLEALHRAATAGRLGFSPRADRAMVVEQACGFLALDRVLVYRRSERLAGYVRVDRGPTHFRVGEVVVGPRDRPGLLDALERTPQEGAIVFVNTPALDLAAELRRRGYLVRRGADWRALMAKPLRGTMTGPELRRELGVDDPSFVAMAGDRF